MTPVCAQCTSLIVPEGCRAKPHRWLCIKHPVTPGTDFLTGEQTAPYKRCQDINKYGLCAAFEPGPNTLHPRLEAAQ